MGGFALIHIALQLFKRLGHWVGTGCAAFFTFHHNQRNAIHKKHNIGNDKLFNATGRINAELVDGMELIVLRMRKIYQFHHRVLFTGEFVKINLGFKQ